MQQLLQTIDFPYMLPTFHSFKIQDSLIVHYICLIVFLFLAMYLCCKIGERLLDQSYPQKFLNKLTEALTFVFGTLTSIFLACLCLVVFMLSEFALKPQSSILVPKVENCIESQINYKVFTKKVLWDRLDPNIQVTYDKVNDELNIPHSEPNLTTSVTKYKVTIKSKNGAQKDMTFVNPKVKIKNQDDDVLNPKYQKYVTKRIVKIESLDATVTATLDLAKEDIPVKSAIITVERYISAENKAKLKDQRELDKIFSN